MSAFREEKEKGVAQKGAELNQPSQKSFSNTGKADGQHDKVRF